MMTDSQGARTEGPRVVAAGVSHVAVFVLTVLFVHDAMGQASAPPPGSRSDRDAVREQRRERRRRLVRELLDGVTLETTVGEAASGDGSDSEGDFGSGRGGDRAQNEENDGGSEEGAGAAAVPPRGGASSGLLGRLGSVLAPLRGEAGKPEDREPIDPARLNRVLEEEIARPLAEDLEEVEALELRLDEEKTDFARDRLGVSGRLGLRSTPWGGPADIGLGISASVKASVTGTPRAIVSFQVDLASDTVAMMNFFKQRVLERHRRGESLGEDAEASAAMGNLLESTPDFRSLTDVADFLPEMGVVNLIAVNRKIALLKAQIDPSADVPVNKHLAEQLAEAYKARDNLLASSIRVQRDGQLEVDEILVSIPGGGGAAYQFAELEYVDMVITGSSLRGQIDLSIGPGGVLLYRGAKGLVVEPALRRLQQRDPATLDRLRQGGQNLHRQLEELQGTPPEVETLPEPDRG